MTRPTKNDETHDNECRRPDPAGDGLLLIHESNAPSGAFPPISQVNGRYTYDTHAMFSASWGMPLPANLLGDWAQGWGVEGYLN